MVPLGGFVRLAEEGLVGTAQPNGVRYGKPRTEVAAVRALGKKRGGVRFILFLGVSKTPGAPNEPILEGSLM